VVWDGLLASLLDDGARRRFRVFDAAGAKGKALNQWTTDPIACLALIDIAYRRSIPVDLVTLLDKRYLPRLRERAKHDSLPVNEIFAHTEDSLDEYARLTPFVLRVIHPYVDRPFAFGSKGLPVSRGVAWQLT
jgi:hypothetical protein